MTVGDDSHVSSDNSGHGGGDSSDCGDDFDVN